MSTIAEWHVCKMKTTGWLVARAYVPDAPLLPAVIFRRVESEAEAPAVLQALVARFDREGWPPIAPGGDDAWDARARRPADPPGTPEEVRAAEVALWRMIRSRVAGDRELGIALALRHSLSGWWHPAWGEAWDAGREVSRGDAEAERRGAEKK